MKTNIIVLFVFLLVGCNQSTPQWVNESAINHCGGADEVHQVFYDERIKEGSVTCDNGIYYAIKLQENK